MARPRPVSAQVAKQRRDGALAALVAGVPYARFLGVSFDRRGDELTGLLSFDEKLIGNPMLPAIHGGVTSAFLELTALITLSWTGLLPAIDTGEIDPVDVAQGDLPRLPKTIDLTVIYLRTGLPRDAYSRAIVSRSGRRFATVRVEAWQDQRDRPFAQAAGHFLMPRPESDSG